jgi:hypothetical protein
MFSQEHDILKEQIQFIPIPAFLYNLTFAYKLFLV